MKTEKISIGRTVSIHLILTQSYITGWYRPSSKLHVGLSCASLCHVWEKLRLWKPRESVHIGEKKPPWNPAWFLQHLQAQSDLNCLKTQEDWCRNGKPPFSYSKSLPGFRWWLKSDSIKITVIIIFFKKRYFCSLPYLYMIKLHHWVGTKLESKDTCELELSRSSRTQRRTEQPLLIPVLSACYRTTNFMGTKWIAPDKHNPLKQRRLRAVSGEGTAVCRSSGQSHWLHTQTMSWATMWLQHTVREFDLADKTGLQSQQPGYWQTSVFQASLPGSHQTRYSCLAAPQHSYLEGRRLKCDEAPNQSDAKGCLQGARWFKFPEESLWQWNIFRISEHGKIKS